MDFLTRKNILEKYGIALSESDFKENQSKKVILGMSGGVDSSVCAVVLKLQGYNVTGMFMKNWEEEGEDGRCTSEAEYEDVVSVCEELEIPYYSVNFVEEYKENVFAHFVKEYEKGFTPNPDILCNREIKFKVFYQRAIDLGADYLATGHYCRTNNKGELLKGLDDNKDQTYFLYAVNGEVLEKVLFPIGDLEKPVVRKIAEDFNLVTYKKKDSTGICFIGERNFKNFLSQYIKETKGNFIHKETGKVLGQHDGACFYTIGQRKGLGLGGPGGPWFVAGKNIETNDVYVVEGEKNSALYAKALIADEITWVKEVPSFPLRCKAKIRYRQPDQDCLVELIDGELKVTFEEAQRAIAIRQSVVLYHNDKCLGGGIIKERLEDLP